MLLILACSGDPTSPDLGPGRDPGDGTSGGGNGSAALVGTWRTVVVVEVPGDIQTWTTTWTFDDEGFCRQTIVTESLAEGTPRTTDRACSYSAGDFEVMVDFVGGGTLILEYRFAGFSRNRLVLDGFEYERLA
ncbi:MAG: hypothetical protein ACREMX_00355 [Gemmatimonadales bacterium]